MKPEFRYVNATDTAKPGYLSRKWHKLFPGWNKPPKPRPVIQLRQRIALAK